MFDLDPNLMKFNSNFFFAYSEAENDKVFCRIFPQQVVNHFMFYLIEMAWRNVYFSADNSIGVSKYRRGNKYLFSKILFLLSGRFFSQFRADFFYGQEFLLGGWLFSNGKSSVRGRFSMWARQILFSGQIFQRSYFLYDRKFPYEPRFYREKYFFSMQLIFHTRQTFFFRKVDFSK